MYWSAQTHHFLKLIQRCRMKVQDRSVSLAQDCTWENTISVQHLTVCNKLSKCQLTLLMFQGWWVLGMDPTAPIALVLRGEGNSPFLEQSLSAVLALHWGTAVGQDWDPWQPLCREVVFRVGVNFSGLSPCLLLWVCVGLQSP